MRTLSILSNATRSNVADAIKLATSRGWTPEQINRLGNDVVRAAMHTAQASTKPAGAKAVAAKPQPASKAAPAPRTVDLSHAEVAVKLVREGEANAVVTKLLLSKPRPKLRGEGTTYDAALDGTADTFTLSPDALDRLLNGRGTRVWMGGKSYTAVRA